MPQDDAIAENLDSKFIELFIDELNGQSRLTAVSDLSGLEATDDAAEPDDEPAFFRPPDEPGRSFPSGDATPVDGLPALQDEAEPSGQADRPLRPPSGPPPTGKVLLLITEPKLRERVYRLHKKPVTIGRGKEVDISLRDNKTSRQHLRIEKVEGRIMVEDLGSQNGTRVNGRKIRQPIEVISGDEIQIGRTMIRVRRETTKDGASGDTASPEDVGGNA